MIAISNGLTVFGEPLLLVALIVLAFALLEAERVWTRSRRKRGVDPGAMAYLLDGLVLAAMALALAGTGTLFIQGLMSIAELLGGVFDGRQVGLLIVGMALALGLALALARIASGRRAAQDAASAMAAAPLSLSANLAVTSLAGAPNHQPESASMPSERYDDESLPSLALLQERWQPAAAPATAAPTSFLELAESGANKQPRSRFAPALLTLALVVMLVSAAVLFRGQVIGVLAGISSASGEAATTSGEAAVQPHAGAEAAAANVSVAAAPAASATAVANQPVAAPLPANGAQGTTKRVKSDGLNMRVLPGTDQQVVVVLKKGTAVTVFTDAQLIRDTIWVKVRFGDQEGWVDQSLLE